MCFLGFFHSLLMLGFPSQQETVLQYQWNMLSFFWNSNVSPVKFLLIEDQIFIWNESQKTEMYLGYFNWFQEISLFFWAIQILFFVNSPLNR